MNNTFTILNRKTPLIINAFILNFFLLTVLVIWGINTLSYQSFLKVHSNILKIDSFYYLEVLIPIKEVNQITIENKLIIDNKTYNFNIYKTDPNITYKNNTNYQKIYLQVFNLNKEYQINGYQIEIKLLKEKKKIINYLKEWGGKYE